MDESLFEDEARRVRGAYSHNADVALRVYTSRLIGPPPALVLPRRRQSSCKTRIKDDVGDEVDVLCVTAAGADHLGMWRPRRACLARAAGAAAALRSAS
jgi:rhamnose utilization protein RhaD (predicted bifunctional aldolase and dehydrogenase)